MNKFGPRNRRLESASNELCKMLDIHRNSSMLFRMGKKRRILWAVLLVAVVAAVVWLSMPSPEPVYQGKRLSCCAPQGAIPANPGASQ
jgi:hypothetical protein